MPGASCEPWQGNAELTPGHIFGKFGHVPLENWNKILLKSWLNEFAKSNSESQVKHCRIYLKINFEGRRTQDYIRKNPAKKLTMPHTRAVIRPHSR